jgi:hypothetical protein
MMESIITGLLILSFLWTCLEGELRYKMSFVTVLESIINVLFFLFSLIDGNIGLKVRCSDFLTDFELKNEVNIVFESHCDNSNFEMVSKWCQSPLVNHSWLTSYLLVNHL